MSSRVSGRAAMGGALWSSVAARGERDASEYCVEQHTLSPLTGDTEGEESITRRSATAGSRSGS